MALLSSWAAHSVMSEWPSCVRAPEGMIPGCLAGPTCSGNPLQSAVVRQALMSSATSGPTTSFQPSVPTAVAGCDLRLLR